jgi:outer membrane protein TolC
MKPLLLRTISILALITGPQFAASLALGDGQAPSSLTLESAIDEGLGKSPTTKKYQSAEDAAGFEANLGFSGLVPHVSLLAQHNFATQYETVPVSLGPVTASVPEVYPQTSYGVEANWTIFDGLANIRHYQATRDLFHAAQEEYSRETFEVRKKIQLAFYDALAAQKFEEVAEENVKTLSENMKQVRFREEGGVATEYDVLRVEVQLSDANTELERTQDNVVIERKKLAQVMGLFEDQRRLEGQLPVPTDMQKVEAVSNPDPNQREDFVAAQFRSAAADHEASASAGALMPAIGLVGQVTRYDNTGYPNQAYGGFRDGWNVGVVARWNILDGGASIARSEASQARAAEAEHAYQEVILTLPANFELWKRRYIYSAHHFDAKSQDVKRSAESFRIASRSFNQGRKTITDVLEAETDLFRARAGVVQSQLDGEEALVELELTLGKDI